MVAGVRMLDGAVNDAVEARALGLNPDYIDIYSASWGPEDDGKTVDGPGPLARRAFIHGVTKGRKGKGSIFVWASGNGGSHTDSCNCDGYANSIYTLSISSATQGGRKPWYLEECSSTLATTYSSGTPGQDRSVATVDMDPKLHPDNLCTLDHTGTSASAPLAAGMAALALQANPVTHLERRAVSGSTHLQVSTFGGLKVSHKFGYGLMDAGAMTSLAEVWTNVPAQHICKSQEVAKERSRPLEGETGWTVNGVIRKGEYIMLSCVPSLKVSHKFGYGLMDAGAYDELGGSMDQCSSSTYLQITGGCKGENRCVSELHRKIEASAGSTLTVSLDVNGCEGTLNEVRHLEHVQCKVTLQFSPRGNLQIVLLSPMGTSSTLLFERPRDIISSTFKDWSFLSVHYWGEYPQGKWTLDIINSGDRIANESGILKKWQLVFFGTAANPIRIKSKEQKSEKQQTDFVEHFDSSIFNEQDFVNTQSISENDQNTLVSLMDDVNNISIQKSEKYMNRKIQNNCDPECDFQGCYGEGPSLCVACRHHKLGKGECVRRCPSGSFPGQTGVCIPCHESCGTCTGAGGGNCITCAPAHLHVTDLAVCLQQCPEGYIHGVPLSVRFSSGFFLHLSLYNPTGLQVCISFHALEMSSREVITAAIVILRCQKKRKRHIGHNLCVPCKPNCASCQDQPDHCDICENHLVLYNNECYAVCPVYTYETEDYSCAPCHSSCETCRGPTSIHCISCHHGHFSLNGGCLKVCPQGYYEHRKRKECLECPPGCSTCNSTYCITCEEGWKLDKNGGCALCGSSHCDLVSATTARYSVLDHVSHRLVPGPRHLHALSTHVSELYVTLSTVPSAHLVCIYKAENVGQLVLRATTVDHGVCAKCYMSCRTCSGPDKSHCVSCPNEWQLAGGECSPVCPGGFFLSRFGCQRCEGRLNCTSCTAPFMLERGLCIKCLGSQYYDPTTQLCRPCHESCLTCSGQGSFSCLSCLLPLHLDRLSHQCVQCCAEKKHWDCCHCDNVTGECLSSSPASKRRKAASIQHAHDYHKDSGGTARLHSSFVNVTQLAVIASFTVTVMVLILAVLLAKSWLRQRLWRMDDGYKRLSTNICEAIDEKAETLKRDNSCQESYNNEEQLFEKT
uniref:P/Homo B domain-containing protein n=1 Tax=Timema cristinae TaxID=61476 RepID=A0A7R9H9U9_TIMCR|nr:unnamed protein product [Timema cristinae]